MPAPGSLLHTIQADIAAASEDGRPGPLQTAARIAFTVKLQSVLLFRLSHAVGRRSRLAGAILKYVNQVLSGADVAHEARIGPGLVLNHPAGVVIGPNAVLGAGCILQQGVTLGHGPGGSPTCGDRVFLGPGAKCFGGITIGDRARIGANAVVTSDIPGDHFAAGIPARVLKENPPDMIKP